MIKMPNSNNEYLMLFMDFMQIMGFHKAYCEDIRQDIKKKLSHTSLPINGLMIPLYIKYHDNCNQKEIAETLNVTEAFISKTIRELEEYEFITRKTNEKNRRQKLLSLSDKGEKFINEFIKIDKQWEKEVTKNIKQEELTIFKKVLEKILKENQKL